MLPNTKMARSVIDLQLPSSYSESVIDLRLPQDLVTEILLYLPVKSLVRFKCVSKPWLSLISSSQFIKSHLATSSREGHYSNHQLLFNIEVPASDMKLCSLSAALHNPSTNVSDIEYPSPDPQVNLEIVGIINGLVCLAIGKDELYLWNPNLRESKHLPSSNFSPKDFWRVAHGFGYNESNDDYKVVIVSGLIRGGKLKVKVYSLRADSWREIEDFKGGGPEYNGTYANGKIWWTASSKRISASGWNWKMVSLDMASDKYEEVQGPFHEAGVHMEVQGPFHEAGAYNSDWVVTVLGGCFYVVRYYFRKKTDLWVMNKFGAEESWSKVVSVPYNDAHDPAKPYAMKNILCISSNGEIVLEDRNCGLFVYSSKDKEFRKIQLHGLGSFFEVIVYTESLVSPNGL